MSAGREKDAELARRCAAEIVDDEAWHDLWGRYKTLVAWRIRSTLPESLRDDTEDVLIETFAKFRTVASEYNPAKSSLGSFLATVAANLAHDWERQTRRRRQTDTDARLDLISVGPDLNADLFLEQCRIHLGQIANHRKRQVFSLFLDHTSLENVRAKCQLPQSTAYRLWADFWLWLATVASSLTPTPKITKNK